MAHALNAAGYRAPELDDVFKRQPADVNAARRGARPSYERDRERPFSAVPSTG